MAQHGTAKPREERGRWLPPLFLLLLGIAVYLPAFDVPELFDDETAISQNPTIRQLWPLSVPLNPPATAGTGGRPLANLTFALNHAWSGSALWSYHLVNLAIHLAAALTLFGITRRTLLRFERDAAVTPDAPPPFSRPTIPAFLAAALWTAHPLATIAVTYLSQRTESLMALFYLLTIYAFIRAVSSRSTRWSVVSVGACLCGMGCKEVMVTAPVAVLLYDRTFAAGSFRAALRARWKYYACLAATWIPLAFLLRTGLEVRLVGFDLGVEWWRYALTESRAILLYLQRSLWPANLVFDYGPQFLTAAEAVPYILILATLAAGTLFALWRRPVAGFLAAWFFLVLAPTSSVVPVAAQPIAENRAYLPMASILVAGTLLAGRFAGRRGLIAVAAAVLVLTGLSHLRNRVYVSPLALWTDTIARRPANSRAYDQRGEAWLAAGRIDAAIADYQQALALNPTSTHTHPLLADAYLLAGHREQAAFHYRKAIELNPTWAPNHHNLATLLARSSDPASAVPYFQEAIRLNPNLAVAHAGLGHLLLSRGYAAEAVGLLRHAVALNPADAVAHYDLGLALLQLGEFPAAASQLAELVRQDPGNVDARNAYGVALMNSVQLGAAAREFETILRNQPDHTAARENLERVHALQAQRRPVSPSPEGR